MNWKIKNNGEGKYLEKEKEQNIWRMKMFGYKNGEGKYLRMQNYWWQPTGFNMSFWMSDNTKQRFTLLDQKFCHDISTEVSIKVWSLCLKLKAVLFEQLVG